MALTVNALGWHDANMGDEVPPFYDSVLTELIKTRRYIWIGDMLK